METVTFITADGEEVKFYVEEQTTLGGVNYLLVSDSQEDDANALLLKDVSPKEAEEAEYVIVEDDAEIEAVLRIFEEIMEDTSIRV